MIISYILTWKRFWDWIFCQECNYHLTWKHRLVPLVSLSCGVGRNLGQNPFQSLSQRPSKLPRISFSDHLITRSHTLPEAGLGLSRQLVLCGPDCTLSLLNLRRPAGDPVDSDRSTTNVGVALVIPTLTSVATDGLIQHELELPTLNFDRFHQPCLFSHRAVLCYVLFLGMTPRLFWVVCSS